MKRHLKWTKDLIKKAKIQEVRYRGNVRPHMRQDNCYIDTEAPKLNPFCSKCAFISRDPHTNKLRASKFSRMATELGINGYMTNQPDGLKPETLNSKPGVSFRRPTTKIIHRGYSWKCHNPEATARGKIDILGPQIPPCRWRIILEEEDKKLE